MILLEKKDYFKVVKSLEKVTINNLFAMAIIDGSVRGSVYVDDTQNPKTFYIVHPYGMALLFGDINNKKFNESFYDYALNTGKTRNNHEWLQVFPNTWNDVLLKLFKNDIVNSKDNIKNHNNKIELNTRVNFKFDINKYKKFKQKHPNTNLDIKPTNKSDYELMRGSVIPSNFWENSDDFLKKGVGFSLFHENDLATTAFSSFITNNQLELGMETIENYRGKGFAQYACSSLIDYCIDNNYEPIWACRLENIGSYKLAMKLGFEPSITLPYFRLCK